MRVVVTVESLRVVVFAAMQVLYCVVSGDVDDGQKRQ